MRWVQSALNDVLGLRLPVHGIADAATRSAIRSFQQREGLPVDGVLGPETERALIAARRGTAFPGGATSPTGPETSEPVAGISEPDATQSMEPAPMPAAAGAEGELSRLARPCGCPSCRRGKPCSCKSQMEDLMTNIRYIQPEAFEFQPETSFGEFEFESDFGGEAPMGEFEWGAHEFEVAIPRTIHRLDCPAGCPGGLTEAQCAPIVSRAVSAAIKLANNAANKLEAATKIEPSKRDSVAKETARLFKVYFGHDPSKPISHAGNEASGVNVANRFRAVAKELAGGRRFVFRCVLATCPEGTASTPGDATHPPCCANGSRAFAVLGAAHRNVVHLCPPFWNLPEASRGGTILHELLHLRYPTFLAHAFRRANAHCYKAFALRVGGHGRDFPADCRCWGLNPRDPAQRNECRRRLGLPPV